MSEITDYLIKVGLPFLTGGLAGATTTIIHNRVRGKIQTMECHYIDDDVISKLPVPATEGETHNNIYSKQFILKNTTNSDHKDFVIIFEFDITAKIIRYTDTTKGGVDRLKKKLLKPNEYMATIKNFNRKDEVKFIFEIANVSDDCINITEDNCTGFKIQLKDKRKAMLKSKMTVVDKGRLNAIQ
jgi:hypothetical protein